MFSLLNPCRIQQRKAMRGRGRMRMLRRGGGPMMMMMPGGRPVGGAGHHGPAGVGGMPGHHMGGGGYKPPRQHILRMPFDMYVSESFYPRVAPLPDDKELTQSLIKRHAELVPTPVEQTAIQSLVLKVQGVLEGLTVAPGTFEACVRDDPLY